MKTELECIVVTPGGAGSTFVLRCLSNFLRTNDPNSQRDGIKHIHTPQHPILDLYDVKRAVYLFDDPQRAVLSIFRRGYQHVIPKVNANHRSAAEYLDYVRAHTPELDLDEFLRRGVDLFRCERHFRNWTELPAPFPRLFLKYGHLYEQLPRLFAFLGLPAKLLARFPAQQPRESRLEAESAGRRRGLEAMYGDLSRTMASLPAVWEIPAAAAGPPARPARERLNTIRGGTPAVLEESGPIRRARMRIREGILDGVEWIRGPECRRALERDGLQQMHRHFPREGLPLLNAYLNYACSKQALQAIKTVCRAELGLGEEFYLESVVVYRVHFPYGEAGPRGRARRRAVDRLRSAWYRVALAFPSLFPGYPHPTFRKPYEDGHPPHRDYWFGYALDALNLWWAMEDVSDDSGMVLFPETTGRKQEWRRQGSPYLAPGQRLTAPRSTPLRAGEILAFTTNDLHGTWLNESPNTRIVVSVRVSPEKPKFYQPTAGPIFRGLFHPASRLDREDFRTLWNSRHDGYELWAEPQEAPWSAPACRRVAIDLDWPGRRFRLFPKQMLGTDDRVTVKFRDREIVVFRTAKGPVALSARCPHEGYRLEDGYNDGVSVRCPGHAVKFRFQDGTSACNLTVKTYACTESDDGVYLEDAVTPTA